MRIIAIMTVLLSFFVGIYSEANICSGHAKIIAAKKTNMSQKEFSRKFYLLTENKNKGDYYTTENFTFQNRKRSSKLFVSSVPTERKGKMYCTTRISGYMSSRR